MSGGHSSSKTNASGTDQSGYYDANQYYYSGYGYTSGSGATADASNYSYDSSQYYYDPSYYSQYYSPSAASTPASSNTKYTPAPAPPSMAATPSSTGYNNSPTPSAPLGYASSSTSGYTGPGSHHNQSSSDDKKKGKKKSSLVRAAGGEVWDDPSLLEWDENDYRLFAGDLGNEVTDELLFKAFQKYPSLQRTRVVREKRTGKSKGYGFISFTDPTDFVKAWREMNGKYVGNRPIKLRKSSWKDRNMDVRAKKERERSGPYSKNR
ncbi:hypothetical protein DFQ28_008757 [Apophysomyces sp. BC1034]|nr:hypothetical protein DFQ30_004978 [Apophysomyces sp. BC1015]KAG0174561.1 hypothetical protein DFQ29_007442 [Apophysomyces sp. BC1021]KAG0185796.1 hypothetical protein DFQ28_008757 [Apophysomyces sp. BC1034]